MSRDWTQQVFGITGKEPDAYEQLKSELSKVKEQLAIAKDFIFRCANDISGDWYINSAKCVLQKMKELEK